MLVFGQYDTMLLALQETSEVSTNTAATAYCFKDQFEKDNMVLGLTVTSCLIGDLECLNRNCIWY